MALRYYTNSLLSVKRRNNKYFLSISFIILISFVVILHSCQGPDRKELIVRKWKCEQVEFADSSRVSEKDMQDMEIVKGVLRNVTYEYFADGQFEALVGESTRKGSWKMDEDEKFITLHYDKGKVREEKYEIISLSESQMTLEIEQTIPLLFTYMVYSEKF